MSEPRHAAELDVELTPLQDAIGTVLGLILQLAPTSAVVGEADGLVLAADVKAPEAIPRWDNSSMDGYAVSAAQTATAPVILNSPRIMTGHPLPPGTDAVVPWEETELVDGGVRIVEAVAAGKFVRKAGEDVTADSTVMKSGERLTPAHLGLLSAMGVTSVEVVPRPRVSVICTGDELVAPGTERTEDQIYDANGAMLSALLQRAGVAVTAVRYVADDKLSIGEALAAAVNEADAVITTGGASVGEHDWTRDVIEQQGRVALWRVALRPGKPFAFGIVDETPVFVLPGNPASVLACAHAFAIPALRKMAGRTAAHHAQSAVLSAHVEAFGARMFLCPVYLAEGKAQPMRLASSSVLSNQLNANGFVSLEPGTHSAGERVVVELFD